MKLRECSLTAQVLALPVLPLPLLASCTNQRLSLWSRDQLSTNRSSPAEAEVLLAPLRDFLEAALTDVLPLESSFSVFEEDVAALALFVADIFQMCIGD